MNNRIDYRGLKVYTRDGKTCGYATGATYPCQMDGCRGVRVVVKWSNGKNTRPCSQGMKPYKNGLRII